MVKFKRSFNLIARSKQGAHVTFLLLRHFGHIKLFPHESAWQADIVGRESGLIRRLKFAIIRVVCRKKLHCVFGKHRWSFAPFCAVSMMRLAITSRIARA
jgi:hypothetical protein